MMWMMRMMRMRVTLTNTVMAMNLSEQMILTDYERKLRKIQRGASAATIKMIGVADKCLILMTMMTMTMMKRRTVTEAQVSNTEDGKKEIIKTLLMGMTMMIMVMFMVRNKKLIIVKGVVEEIIITKTNMKTIRWIIIFKKAKINCTKLTIKQKSNKTKTKQNKTKKQTNKQLPLNILYPISAFTVFFFFFLNFFFFLGACNERKKKKKSLSDFNNLVKMKNKRCRNLPK